VESKERKIILFVVALVVNIAITGSGAAAAEFVVHNGDSIQAAVNNSNPGDLIIVKPGTYREQISAYTNGLTIRSQSGNPDDTIIQGPGFTILASKITINGFTIKGNDGDGGIAVIDRMGECRIENNKILNSVSGIDIPTGSASNVANNNEISNCQYGIAVSEGFENIVIGLTQLKCRKSNIV